MNLGPFRFAPPWWGVLLFCVGAAIFCSMGVWQIERAHYKASLLAEQQAAQAAGPGTITAEAAAAQAATESPDGAARFRHGREFVASGRYDGAHQILLSDQLHGGEIGYRVWTPLVLDNGIRVMVDRGWIAKSADRDIGDVPDQRIRVSGHWRAFPQPGLNWNTVACGDRGWPRILSFPDTAAVRCQYASPVLDGLLLLDADAPHGFIREWSEEKDTVGLRPWGHYAYASQWFLMAVVAGVILVVVNLRRRTADAH